MKAFFTFDGSERSSVEAGDSAKAAEVQPAAVMTSTPLGAKMFAAFFGRRRKQYFFFKILIALYVLYLVFVQNVFNVRLFDRTLLLPMRAKLPKLPVLSEIRNAWRRISSNSNELPHLANRIKPNRSVDDSNTPVCQRVRPLRGSRELAQALFSNQEKKSCTQQSVEICSLKKTSPAAVEVQCDLGSCEKSAKLGTVNPDTGALDWEQFDSPEALQEAVTGVIQGTGKKANFGFCFLKCTLKGQAEHGSQEDGELYDHLELKEASQLLILPPRHTPTPQKDEPQKKAGSTKLSFNIILVDSVSRHHFYRTLPQTLQVFESLNAGAGTGAKVLDFELVQALRSRTFENLEALFSGYINPAVKPFGVLELPPEPLGIGKFLKPLKDQGYSTMFLEDLCYTWEWGLSKDLHVYNFSLPNEKVWLRLLDALKKASIDSVDAMLANCQILSANFVHDHFHGPDVVCFNGRHQHDYLFEYLTLYQEQKAAESQPFASIFETNIGHEDTGRRISLADDTLAEYVKFVSQLENTLTVIFSDHGNAYGQFIELSQEGKMELYHPFLFMIIPDSVAGVLGNRRMEGLIVNQKRLITLLDIHFTLMSLIQPGYQVSKLNKQFNVTADGLFSEVSPARTCSQLPLIMPNLCICQGFDTIESLNSYNVLFAHLALGRINNAIQAQFRRHQPSSTAGFGKCQRLHLDSVENIRKSFLTASTIQLKMDLLVQTGDSHYGKSEVFFVAVEVALGGGRRMILHKFDRLSPYSKYAQCADKGVDLSMCVCSLSTANSTQSPAASLQGKELLMDAVTPYEVEDSGGCLHVIVQTNRDGGVYYGTNSCPDRAFQVDFQLEGVDVDLSDTMPVSAFLRPGDVTFLAVSSAVTPHREWNASFLLRFSQSRV